MSDGESPEAQMLRRLFRLKHPDGHMIHKWRGKDRMLHWQCNCGLAGSSATSRGRLDQIGAHGNDVEIVDPFGAW